MNDAIDFVLSELDIHPVLIDIGASGSPPSIWNEIAARSIRLGFDPDKREVNSSSEGHFRKSIIVDAAVTSNAAEAQVLYLTRSPFCSSTLKPDQNSLKEYTFCNLFTVDSETRARAITLEKALREFSLSRVDWFKSDSQGVDLRLFQSLPLELRERVLAVDVEPGLIHAYLGEDLFVEAHSEFGKSGFWLSNLKVYGAVRMRRSSFEDDALVRDGIDVPFVEQHARVSPGWCEARYLRTLDSLASIKSDPRDYALLWIFALLDRQLGFAIDISIEYEKLFGTGKISEVMKQEPIALLKREAAKRAPRKRLGGPIRLIRGLGRKILTMAG